MGAAPRLGPSVPLVGPANPTGQTPWAPWPSSMAAPSTGRGLYDRLFNAPTLPTRLGHTGSYTL